MSITTNTTLVRRYIERCGIVAGALDEATPPSQSGALHAAMRGSDLILLPAGHVSIVEQPAAFNAHLLRFLISGITAHTEKG